MKREEELELDIFEILKSSTFYEIIAHKIVVYFEQERTKDCYPKEFVKWWFAKGLMEFAIESFSTPFLFIKFDEGSKKKYTLYELFIYWRDKIK